MSGFRFYNFILISMVLLLGSVLAYMSLSTQPYDGDLTRLGGFSEKLYGWNNAQETFEHSLFNYAISWKDYDKHYDIVVFGDSFSKDKYRGWQNFLANNTGLSIITFHVERFSLKDLVTHPQFIKSPPYAVIYESVERMAIPRLARENSTTPVTDAAHQMMQKPILSKPQGHLPQQKKRDTTSSFINRLNVTSDLVSKAFLRDTVGLNLFKSTTLELTQGLFSSKKDTQLLFLKNHLSQASLSLFRLQDAVQGALNIKNLVQKNAFTRFYLMIFPNKISVYRDKLTNTSIEIVSFYDFKKHFDTVNLIPLYAALKNVVAQGVIDVYFSNDTHTSAIGYKLSALELQSAMEKDGVLIQP